MEISKGKAVFLLLCLIFAVSSCGGLLGPLGFEIGPSESPDEPGSDRLLVVTSIYPLTCLVDEIGTYRVDTQTLLPPGENAHMHELTPEQMTQVTDADLLLRIGGGLDDWVLRSFAMARDRARRISVTDTARSRKPAARPGSPDSIAFDSSTIDWSNPHLWLDPLIVRDVVVPLITENLIAADPEGKEHYQAHSARFRSQLTGLHEELKRLMSGLPSEKFLSDHPAWTHFAQRYGLTQVDVLQTCTASEPDPATLSRIIDDALEKDVSVVLTTRGHSDQLARRVAESINAALVEMDPIGDPGEPDRRGYFGLLRYNATRLRRALSAEQD